MPAAKKGLSTSTSMLLGIIGGGGAGAGLGIAHRKLFPYSLMEAPEESFEMPTAPAARGIKPTRREKRGGYPALGAGAAIGLPAGYGIATMLMDRARSKQLDRYLADSNAELDNAMLREQGASAKQAQVVDIALRKIASACYGSVEKRGAKRGGDLREMLKLITDMPKLQKQILGGLAGAATLGGGIYGADRALTSDKGRARMNLVRKSLAARLIGDGKDGLSAPMVLKVRQSAPSMVPLRHGASSLDPSMGRDVLEGI